MKDKKAIIHTSNLKFYTFHIGDFDFSNIFICNIHYSQYFLFYSYSRTDNESYIVGELKKEL